MESINKQTQVLKAEASLMEYPSQFPIKVMGLNENGFVNEVTTAARKHDPVFDASTIDLRESSEGKYLSVTISIKATSREQLDNLYRELTSNPRFKYVL